MEILQTNERISTEINCKLYAGECIYRANKTLSSIRFAISLLHPLLMSDFYSICHVNTLMLTIDILNFLYNAYIYMDARMVANIYKEVCFQHFKCLCRLKTLFLVDISAQIYSSSVSDSDTESKDINILSFQTI